MDASQGSRPATSFERRIAENGHPYTRKQFMQYYESDGELRWTEAAQLPVQDDAANQRAGAMGSTEGRPADSGAAQLLANPVVPAVHAPPAAWTAPDVGRINSLIESFLGPEHRAVSRVPIAPSHTILGMAQMLTFDAHALRLAHSQQNTSENERVTTHHCGNAMGSTDGPPADGDAAQLPAVLLPQHVIAIQNAEATRGPPRALHRLARDALNAISNSPTRSTVNLDNHFPWVQYVCAHSQSADIIGTGITHAEAVWQAGTNDANRGGAPRLDFCFYRTNGTVCRVHPGDRRRNDARLKFETI